MWTNICWEGLIYCLTFPIKKKKKKQASFLSAEDKFINICEVLGIIIMISDLEKMGKNESFCICCRL